MQYVNNTVKRWLSIRPGEGRLAGLMFLYNFVLLITLYLLKPVRDSLFLVELGPGQLPFVFILIAVTVIPISMAYSRYSMRSSMGWVIYGVTLFLAVNLVVIWWLLRLDAPALYYILYVWVSIYSVLITSQFWLLANSLFDVRQARRLFSLLSLAAIAGAIAGGEMTGFLVNVAGVDTPDLLIVAALLLVATLAIVRAVRREVRTVAWAGAGAGDESAGDSADKPDGGAAAGGLLAEVSRSRHLLLIVGIIALSVVTTALIDYQFKTVAARAFPTDDSLTAFMGQFYGRVSVAALLLQFFFSSRFIERRGVGGAVVLLPSVLLLGTAGFFLWPGLVTGVLLRGTDQSLKHSLDRTGRELLFMPVELNLKKRSKILIDLFVDNGAQGLAGLLLVLLTFGLGLSVQYLSLVVLALLLCWITLALWVRGSYVNEIRESIEDQVAPQGEDDERPAVDSITEARDALGSADEDRITAALEQLRQRFSGHELSADLLLPLLGYGSALVRRQTLRVMRSRRMNGYSEEVAQLLNDENEEVRLEAARYFYRFYDRDLYHVDRLDILQLALNHDDAAVRATAFGVVAKEGGRAERDLVTDAMLEQALGYRGADATELRVETARLLGEVYTDARAGMLQRLLHDGSEKVVRQAIVSAGKSRDRRFVYPLLGYLAADSLRRTAQKGLALYGERIFGTLYDYMTDEHIPVPIRKAVPPVLYLNAGLTAIDVLQMALDRTIAPVRHEVIRALNRIRRTVTAPVLDRPKLIAVTYKDARRYVLLRQTCGVMRTGADPGLLNLLEAEMKHSFENIFRLLGLLYDATDIFNAYKGIVSGKPALVSEGIEFMENLLDWEVKKFIQPVLEELSADGKQYEVFGMNIRNRREAIAFLRNLTYPSFEPFLPAGEEGA